ncbi:MAG: metalloregulator ArsR/SmtB family transcription factor [Christensenellaceae bacterium]|jgi:ArsR family transcriptional regulator|nr:metalloregulator ArsR/SmtB family transcription factor [Christensenellaceae bacterium]
MDHAQEHETRAVPDRCDVDEPHLEVVELARRAIGDTTQAERLAELFKVLGDPTRVRILQALDAHTLCVCDIAQALLMTQSAISHQLRVLRQARLVRARREGRSVFYELDDDHVSQMFKRGLEHVLE